MRRLRIVISADWFPPAYRAGGPIRSAFNLCALLAKHHDVWVVTGAHDLGEAEALDVNRDAWNEVKVGNASVQVRYCSQGTLDRRTWGRILDEIKPQVLHLNSMFSKEIPTTMKSGWKAKIFYIKCQMLCRRWTTPQAMAQTRMS